ncbi:MAG: LysE family translocator [Flavobacteriaceae bacterium]|nr:LysE family translocator [Flavobacteriaceae bacterium]
MDIDFNILGSFVLAVAALAISPGPDNIYVLTQSLAQGSKAGLSTVAGLMSGCYIHTTLIAFGVSLIIRDNENLYLLLKILGASYLLYLAFKVYKSHPPDLKTKVNSTKASFWENFKTGFIMNAINPKVAIFFLALFPGFLFSQEMGTVSQFYVLGTIFILVSFIIFGSIALLAGKISTFIKRNERVGIYLKWMQIIVFVGIALLILI